VDHRYAVGTAGAANLQLTSFAVYTLAGKTNDKKLPPIDLPFRQEHVEGTAVARLDDYRHARRILPSPLGFLLVVEVRHEVMHASVAADQPVSLGRIEDESRTSTASWTGLVADDTVHLTIF
jgi:hypothetical protein